jgi:hypothetical protein
MHTTNAHQMHTHDSKDKSQIYTFLNAMLNQYDNEDFDLGIKQFMMEQVRDFSNALRVS